MPCVISRLALAGVVVASACAPLQTGPTTSESLHSTYVAQCAAQGNRDRRGQTACADANRLAPQVAAERAQRDAQNSHTAQQNATIGTAVGAVGGLLGGALLGRATAPHRNYGHGYYRCGPHGCW